MVIHPVNLTFQTGSYIPAAYKNDVFHRTSLCKILYIGAKCALFICGFFIRLHHSLLRMTFWLYYIKMNIKPKIDWKLSSEARFEATYLRRSYGISLVDSERMFISKQNKHQLKSQKKDPSKSQKQYNKAKKIITSLFSWVREI